MMEKGALLVLCAVAVCLHLAAALQVTSSGPQTVKKAQGEGVTLGCTFSESPSDTGDLDVEWSIVSPDMTQKDKVVWVPLQRRTQSPAFRQFFNRLDDIRLISCLTEMD